MGPERSLFVAGLSHHTAPIEVRERLALDGDKVREILIDLVGSGVVAEAMIVATCNRVEVYGVAEVPGDARRVAFERLGGQRGVALAAVEPLLYTKLDDEAVLHVFRVAASLDSMILGEPQILGQVKDAFALAQSAGTVGPVLHALMSQAFGVAKKVRTETEVGRLAVSVSFAAVELARKIFGSLEGKAVLLVGAGEMSELAARHLIDHGAQPVYVANRTWSRAQELARTFAGIAVRFEDVESTMALVDIILTSTAAPEPIVRADAVRQALHARRERPLFFVDIGVPRNVEAAVDQLANAFCYDIDDLRAVVDANLRERQYQAQRAEAVVEREVARFLARRRDLEVVPTIVSLRDKLEAIRQGEVDRALARLPGASEETRRVIEAMSQAIVSKVLHAPIVKLRDSSRDGRGRRWRTLIAEVFGLRGDGGSGGADAGR
jgi:glutamyl-tRNA reductase